MSVRIKRVAWSALLASVPMLANDAAYNRGETLYFSKGCASCHGPSAEGSSTFPRLANQQKSYLVKKLSDFRAGRTSTPPQEMMAQFAQDLSDRNIDDLATFLSEHKKKETPDVNDNLLGGNET